MHTIDNPAIVAAGNDIDIAGFIGNIVGALKVSRT